MDDKKIKAAWALAKAISSAKIGAENPIKTALQNSLSPSARAAFGVPPKTDVSSQREGANITISKPSLTLNVPPPRTDSGFWKMPREVPPDKMPGYPPLGIAPPEPPVFKPLPYYPKRGDDAPKRYPFHPETGIRAMPEHRPYPLSPIDAVPPNSRLPWRPDDITPPNTRTLPWLGEKSDKSKFARQGEELSDSSMWSRLPKAESPPARLPDAAVQESPGNAESAELRDITADWYGLESREKTKPATDRLADWQDKMYNISDAEKQGPVSKAIRDDWYKDLIRPINEWPEDDSPNSIRSIRLLDGKQSDGEGIVYASYKNEESGSEKRINPGDYGWMHEMITGDPENARLFTDWYGDKDGEAGGAGRKHLWVTDDQLQSVLTETGHYQANSDLADISKELNSVLQASGAIPTKQQMQLFLAVCMHESRLALTEAGWLSEEQVKNYCSKYEPGTDIGKRLGNTEPGDGYKFRGAGYIQLTGRDNYQQFSDYIKEKHGYDSRIMAEGADYVAKKYAWEAAVWFWETNNINGVIERGNDNGLDSIDILRQVSNAVFRGNANSKSDPGEWTERQARYDSVTGVY